MAHLPDTRHRVADHTAAAVDARLHEDTARRVIHTLHANDIAGRLDDLDTEWHTERALLTNFGLVALAGLVYAATRGRRPWLTAVAAGFMLQHAYQGWCPPLALLRRLGVRTPGEVENERSALLALRDGGANPVSTG